MPNSTLFHSCEESKTSISFLYRFWGLPALLSLFVFILDQGTKWLVVKTWPEPGMNFHEVIPDIFTLVHWRNKGAAWGIFSDHTWILAVFSFFTLIVLILLFKSITQKNKYYAPFLGMLLGGIAGNFIDRGFYADGVIDFLYFHYKDIFRYPAFNIADSAIVIAIFCIAFIYYKSDFKQSSSDEK